MATLVELFTDIALRSPVSAALLALGALFVAVASGVFGYLSAGAVASLVIPR